jgi:tRNA threonylcarbamoyladenosine biosynthesis protein TsaE
MELITTPATIRKAANTFWNDIKEARIIAFHGEMGSGKTTFIHALCDVKSVKDAVGSPTFSIINQYDYLENGAEKSLFHIDLYRLNSEEEALRAGVEDCFYSGNICLVEWPEKAPDLLPEESVHVHISVTGPETRKLEY